MSPDVRPGTPLPPAFPRRPSAAWALLLLVGSCLNPQPDTFPQTMSPPPGSADSATRPVDVTPVVSGVPEASAPANASPMSSPQAAGSAAPRAPAPIPAGNEAADAGAAPVDAGPEPDAAPANAL